MALKRNGIRVLINLSQDEGVIESLIVDHSIIKIVDGLICEHFSDDLNSAYESHYSEIPALQANETNLLHDSLLFTAILTSLQPANIAFSASNLAEHLWIISTNYHQQFSLEHWILITWNYKNLASSQFDVEFQNIDPQLVFLSRYGETIIKLFTESQSENAT